ncbi:DUF3310 domain-containing protein [Selenomonas ruminantium]|uniref:Protein of unknwon function n=1 Tax=Selenomonas ruminantium TaxID=971 RepID=A0A1I0VJB1_SELRU|nr:DUF3310 domain-containing protein [Selenomonas ruminantium]SFA76117.1 Protein of unknwon function [Selenomonas ruminantium]
MKYKVGDKVRVRKDISVKGNWGFVEAMEQFIGKVVTISRLVDTHDAYLILEDGGEYVWTEEMFEGLAGDEQTDEADKLKYKVGDMVIFIKPLMGMVSDGGFILKEVFAKNDVRRITDDDDKYYFVDDFGSTIKVKHKDLECVTDIYTAEGEANENTNNGNTIRPGYYQSSVGDIFDIADVYGLDFPLGNAVKYICRAGKKNKAAEVEDLEKAVQCIQRAIELRRAKDE